MMPLIQLLREMRVQKLVLCYLLVLKVNCLFVSLFNCFNGSSDPYVNCLEVSALYLFSVC